MKIDKKEWQYHCPKCKIEMQYGDFVCSTCQEKTTKKIGEKELDNARINITAGRIGAEFRKHPKLDWQLISAIKIYFELKRVFEGDTQQQTAQRIIVYLDGEERNNNIFRKDADTQNKDTIDWIKKEFGLPKDDAMPVEFDSLASSKEPFSLKEAEATLKYEIPWWHEYYEYPEKRLEMLDKLPALEDFDIKLKFLTKKQRRRMMINQLECLFDDAMSYAFARARKEKCNLEKHGKE
jgi:hypothetical protein